MGKAGLGTFVASFLICVPCALSVLGALGVIAAVSALASAVSGSPFVMLVGGATAMLVGATLPAVYLHRRSSCRVATSERNGV